MDYTGTNWKARGKTARVSPEDIRKAFASRQCRRSICRVTQQHKPDRRQPKCSKNWLREKEKAVSEIKQ